MIRAMPERKRFFSIDPFPKTDYFFAIVETRMIIDQLEKSTQKGNCVVNKGYDWMKKTDRLDW